MKSATMRLFLRRWLFDTGNLLVWLKNHNGNLNLSQTPWTLVSDTCRAGMLLAEVMPVPPPRQWMARAWHISGFMLGFVPTNYTEFECVGARASAHVTCKWQENEFTSSNKHAPQLEAFTSLY
jgi:hypothetical protein